jgi:hypothetical protein
VGVELTGVAAQSAAQNATNEKAVVFSKANQVAEILREVERLKLNVLIRYSRNGKAVRAIFSGLAVGSGSAILAGISDQGSALLARSQAVKIEFILLSKKIVFVSEVVSRSKGKLTIKIPEKVIAIERRTNARFKVPASHAAFIEFPEKKFDQNDLDSPFVPQVFRNRFAGSPLLRIDDVSLGGVAGFTRYGAVQRCLKGTEEQLEAILYFPNNYPLHVPVSIRWSKKTIVNDTTGQFHKLSEIIATACGQDPDYDLKIKECYYRVGIQFSEVSKDLDIVLRQFIRRLQQAESV